MKKLILSVSICLLSLQGYSQTGGFGGSTTPLDQSNTPSGVGFGGALGGATSPSTTTPSSTGTSSPSTTVPGTGPTDFGIPRGDLPQQQQTTPLPQTMPQQQQQAPTTNFAGGSLGGQSVPSTTAPIPTTPSAAPQPSTVPRPNTTPQSNVPAATGVGTGAPTSF